MVLIQRTESPVPEIFLAIKLAFVLMDDFSYYNSFPMDMISMSLLYNLKTPHDN